MVLIGKLSCCERKTGVRRQTFHGKWRFEHETEPPRLTSGRTFKFQRTLADDEAATGEPKDGDFDGSFVLEDNHQGRNKLISEKQVGVKFVPSPPASGVSFYVKGHGENDIGILSFSGTGMKLTKLSARVTDDVTLRKEYTTKHNIKLPMHATQNREELNNKKHQASATHVRQHIYPQT